MKGSEEFLIQYMGGTSTHFIIPVYQRNYNWKTEQCKQLYDDLVSVSRKGLRNHFFGSLVSVSDPNGGMLDFLIIDGQQRLTTISLLFLAMYNLIQEGKVVPQQAMLAPLIYESFLIDKFQAGEARIKLKHVKNDQEAFMSLFEAGGERVAESNLTINYTYFYNRIQQREISIDALYQSICKLQIINISLNHDDNPQLIFESLNSTGLALDEGDKIRNYILMGLPMEKQDSYYNKYWNPIERYTGYDVSAFVRDYLSIKQQATPAIKSVYTKFKEYKQSEDNRGLGTEGVLKEMLAYAKRYAKLTYPDVTSSASTDLDWCIYRLNRMKTTVTRPFFMEVMRLKEAGRISDAELLQIFTITEIYLFRRTICDLPTNALNKIFLLLNREITRFDGTDENYLQKFIFALNSKRESGRFPSDEEFSTAISQKNIYLMRGESKQYLFERLEHGGLKGGALDVWNKLDNNTLTIEHIMPQTLSHGWIEDLGGVEESVRIHTEWLHRLANLTLTAYNPEYRNHRFLDKLTMKGGFAEGGLHMNSWIKDQRQWTERELMQRDEQLREEALQLWPRPKSAYVPPVKQMESVTLEEDEPLTGKYISRYAFRGIEQPAATWVDLLQQVLMQLHSKDNSVLTKLAVSNDSEDDLAAYFSRTPEDHACRKIDENIYVRTGTSTQTKIALLKKVFARFQVEESQLVFYLHDEEEESDSISGTRQEIRKKYWQFAVPSIREKTGSFSNSGQTVSNTLMGITNRSGVLALCVANFDSVRAEIYIDFGDWNKNKALYDKLFQNKETIEIAFGGPLVWRRSEETRASKLYSEMINVSIGNEADWPRMAEFHAEKMAALMKAVEPYI